MMKFKSKRFVALLLTIIMMMNSLQMTAFAAETDLDDGNQAETFFDDGTSGMSEDIIEQELTYVNPLYEDVVELSDLLTADENAISAFAEEEYCTTIEEAGAIMRQKMVDRIETITVYYETTDKNYSESMKKISDEAMIHTGTPTEGDYLKFQYAGWNCKLSGSSSGNTYYLTLNYTVTYYTTLEQEEFMNDAVDGLLTELNLNGKSDYEKIKGVYDYICANVTYDYDNLNDESYKLKYTAYAALVDKTAVCQGYAVLLYRLLEELDVDGRVIAGVGNGGPHAWNIAGISGSYYNLDSTWDAGQESYNYFLRCNANFGDHTREEEYTNDAFNSAYPMGEEDYTYKEEEFFSVDNVEYKVLGESTVALWNAADVSGAFEIPSQVTYDNKIYSVVEIGNQAFYKNIKLTAVTMPDTVTKIQDGEEIGVSEYCGAFKGCTALETVIFSKNLTYIGNFTFSDDTLLENVILPDRLETIMDEAFEDCSSITNITLPASTTYVGQCAFSGTSIVEFTIPKTCETFSEWALTYIPTLTSIYVEPGHGNYCSENGVLYTADMSCIVCYPSGKTDKKYRLPDQVTTIRSGVFNNPYLEELILNSSISESGLGTAMLQRTNISVIEVPSDNPYLISVDGVLFSKDGKTLLLYPPNKPDSIYFVPSGTIHIGEEGQYTFETCKNLEELYIPSSVENIAGIMWKSEKIKQVVFASESKITSLPGFIFQECIGLETICLPKSIKTLSDDAYGNEFYYCENLKVLYAAPDAGIYNCEYFGCQTLSGCYNLTVYGEGSSNALSQLAAEFDRPYQDVSQESDKVLGITFKDTVRSITEGENVSLDAVVYPKIKSDEILTYTSSDMSIAKVDTDGNVKGIKEGICYITATSQDGAYARCQVQVNRGEVIEGEIKIISQPEDYIGKVGDTAQFTIEADGDGLAYQWQYCNKGSSTWRNSSMTGADTNQIKVNITESRIGQKYRCVLTDDRGNKLISDESKILLAEPEIKIVSQPVNYAGIIGDIATFSVEAVGDGLTYQWQYCNKGSNTWRNSSMTGSNTETIETKITEARIGQKYRCVLTDSSSNKVITNEAQILLAEPDVKIISQPVDYAGTIGDTAVFTVEAEGEELTYQWQYCNKGSNTWRNSSMTGADTNRIEAKITEARIGQKYRCVITAGSGYTVTTDEAQILLAEPDVKIISQPEDYKGTVGDTAVFTVEAEGEELTYQWQYCNKGSNTWRNSSMTGADTNRIETKITEARIGQKYRCVITAGNGYTVTTDEVQILLAESQVEIISQPSDYSGSVGDAATFSVEAVGEGLTYQWQYRTASGNTWRNSGMEGATTPNLTVQVTKARNGQSYRCIISDMNGNTLTSEAALLTVN